MVEAKLVQVGYVSKILKGLREPREREKTVRMTAGMRPKKGVMKGWDGVMIIEAVLRGVGDVARGGERNGDSMSIWDVFTKSSYSSTKV